MAREEELSKLEVIISKELAEFFYKNQVDIEDGLLVLTAILYKTLFICKDRRDLDVDKYFKEFGSNYYLTEIAQRKHMRKFKQKLKDEEVKL